MERIPNEVRLEIVRQLRGDDDRNALVAAYPTWENIVKREENLRSPTIDESRQHGLSTEEFLATFEGPGLRQRQFLEEVRVERFVDAAAYYRACCPITAGKHLTSHEFGDCMTRLTKGIHEVTERAAKAGINIPRIALSLRECADDLTRWKTCSGNHTGEEIQRALAKTSVSKFECHPFELQEYNEVDEFNFRGQGLFQRIHMRALSSSIRKLVGLRVLRLDLKDSSWSYPPEAYRKYGTSKHTPDRDAMSVYLTPSQILEAYWTICILTNLHTQPIEEIHVRLGRRSPRNELRPPVLEAMYERAAPLLRSLSLLPSLTVLRLSGQFFAPICCFDLIRTPSFPALTTFYLGIGPETHPRSWFFTKDTTPLGWSAAARDPAWAECVTLTATGALPQDPPAGPEDYGRDDYYDEGLETEPIKRNRTLPDNATLGQLLLGAGIAAPLMPKIETFSICLEDDFSEDHTPYPFVPPFLTRVFEMHFVLAPMGGGNATLTWKLGQKVNHWRPEDIVLDAWKLVPWARRGGELDILYVE